MRKWKRFKSKASYDLNFKDCISDLIQNDMVRRLHNYPQHSNVTRLEHSLYVSYKSYLVCKRLGLDYYSAARGGLLHDFFLYDRRVEKPYKGLHALAHPKVALENAGKYFALNYKEKDIIKSHMWPLTLLPPKYLESFIVSCIDKYCATVEFFSFNGLNNIYLLSFLQG